MKNHSLRRLSRLLLTLLPVFWLSACFEESVVVKVGKDGSGVVHYRKYSNDAAGAGFLGGLGGGGEEEAKEEDVEDETLKAELELAISTPPLQKEKKDEAAEAPGVVENEAVDPFSDLQQPIKYVSSERRSRTV